MLFMLNLLGKRKKKNGGREMTKKCLIRKDPSKRLILASVLVGHFGMWAIRQSPYLVPERLEEGINEFAEMLKSYISNSVKASEKNDAVCINKCDYIEGTYTELMRCVEYAISKSAIIQSWNKSKKGECTLVFVTAYSHPHPDHDFIDLDALARNIAQSAWLEVSYDDNFLRGDLESDLC